MGYSLITAPQAEPLTLAEAKLHLRVENYVFEDDVLINALIIAARQYAEQLTGRSIVNQQWLYVTDEFAGRSFMGGFGRDSASFGNLPYNGFALEKGPVQSIDYIKYLDMAGVLQTMPASQYAAELTGMLARVTPKFGQIWPVALPQIGAVQIAFTAGYASVDTTGAAVGVPEGLKAWMKLRIGALYENREEVVSGRSITVTPLSFVDSLLDAYQIVRA